MALFAIIPVRMISKITGLKAYSRMGFWPTPESALPFPLGGTGLPVVPWRFRVARPKQRAGYPMRQAPGFHRRADRRLTGPPGDV
jgi:hypothetical protein